MELVVVQLDPIKTISTRNYEVIGLIKQEKISKDSDGTNNASTLGTGVLRIY